MNPGLIDFDYAELLVPSAVVRLLDNFCLSLAAACLTLALTI